MTRSEETYRDWVKGGYFWTSKSLYFMAKGMIEELGEKKGKELFIKQIYEMRGHMGKQSREFHASLGRENSIEEFVKDGFTDSSVFMFAWKGGLKEKSEHEAIIEWEECPFADGFKELGSEGVEIGELWCQHNDNAVVQGYNSEYECVQESCLFKDGLCRLHLKLKD